MEAVAGKTDESVVRFHHSSGEDGGGIGDADDGADDVDFVVVVNAGHFGGFTTDEGAVVGFAGFGGGGDDLVECDCVEVGTAEVVEEEEGAGTLAEDIVDAVIDNVMADVGVVADHLSNDGFGADAVDAGYEGRRLEV